MRVTPLRALCLSICFAVWAAIALAQGNGTPDYAAWQNTAVRAETAVEQAAASDQAFESLRAEIVDWRLQFQTQLSANDTRLQTLSDQITALGPAPEEGQTEAPEIA